MFSPILLIFVVFGATYLPQLFLPNWPHHLALVLVLEKQKSKQERKNGTVTSSV